MLVLGNVMWLEKEGGLVSWNCSGLEIKEVVFTSGVQRKAGVHLVRDVLVWESDVQFFLLECL